MDSEIAYKILCNLLFRLRLARRQRFKAEKWEWPLAMVQSAKGAELEARKSYRAAKQIYVQHHNLHKWP